MKEMMRKGALAGIRVLDLTRVLCGPYATMYMGDMGAEIIKIENPSGGDDTRLWGTKIGGESFYFASFNRSKKSVTINFKSDEGRELFYRLVKDSDVVVENFRPGVTKRLGIDYDTLKEINPRLIYASANGFGSEGPYGDRAGYDIVAQAMGGLLSITGPRGGKPCKAGASVGDILTGLNLVIGILAAVCYRNNTGRGQFLEVALTNSVVSLCSSDVSEYFVTGEDCRSIGEYNLLNAPYGIFEASDDSFVICCGNQKLFELLADDVMGRPELITDPRFADGPSRKLHEAELKELVEEWSKQMTADEAAEAVAAAGIPSSPVMTIDRIYHNEHIAGAQGMFPHVQHKKIGDMTVTAVPIRFSETKAEPKSPAPLLGEDTDTVLTELLGCTAEELTELRDRRAI